MRPLFSPFRGRSRVRLLELVEEDLHHAFELAALLLGQVIEVGAHADRMLVPCRFGFHAEDARGVGRSSQSVPEWRQSVDLVLCASKVQVGRLQVARPGRRGGVIKSRLWPDRRPRTWMGSLQTSVCIWR